MLIEFAGIETVTMRNKGGACVAAAWDSLKSANAHDPT